MRIEEYKPSGSIRLPSFASFATASLKNQSIACMIYLLSSVQ